MLDIWFEEKIDAQNSNNDNHESFRLHLKRSESEDGILIFSDLSSDKALLNGLKGLKSHFHSNCQYRGMLRSSSNKFLDQMCYEFINQDAYLPLLVSNNSIYKHLKASQTEDQTTKNVFIDNRINLLDSDNDISLTGFLAVQKHFSEEQQWNICEEQSYNFLRLGKLKNQLDVAESIIRDAEYIEFNINSIKHSDLTDNVNAPVTGLTIEEACQLMKYSGTANKLKFLNITGYDASLDENGKIGECIAMLLWYFIDGKESSTEYFNGLNKTDFQEYLVQPSHLPIALKFFKHNITGQWWVKLPEELNENEIVIACSKRDYYQACNDEVSDRLMQALSVI